MSAVMTSGPANPGNKVTADIEVEYVEVSGLKLRVGIRPGTGEGPPLLLFNGIGANLEAVVPFVNSMSDREIIVFDMPGTGRSELGWRPRRFSGLCRLTVDLLTRLGYPGALDVAGVSWGGALAQQFARQYPERCRRLVLAATSAGAVMVPGKPSVLTKMATPQRYLSPKFMHDAAPHIYGGEMRDRPNLIAHHSARIIAPRVRGYAYQLLAGLGWTSIHWLHRLRQPTLILAGDDDPLVPAVNAKLMALLIPNNRLHIVEGGGHLFMLHLRDRVAPVIEGFLDEKRPIPNPV